MKIDSILLEGGGTLNESMLQADLVNEIKVFIAPKVIGGALAKSPVEGLGIDDIKDAVVFKLINVEKFMMIYYWNTGGNVFVYRNC